MSIIKELVNMELPEELKKEQFCININHKYHNKNDEMRYGSCNKVLPPDVVASFFEKEDDKIHAVLKHFTDWLREGMSPVSNVAFTEGIWRNLAWEVEQARNSFLEKKKKELQGITTKILTSLSTLAVSINKPAIKDEDMKNIIDYCKKVDAVLDGEGKTTELSEKEMGGYQDGWLACEMQNKETLENKKKELKKVFCQRQSLGYPCGKVSKDCPHCCKIDTVFGGEGK